MSYREMQRRLADLEQEAARTAEQAYTTWIESLSDAEFDALVAQMDPAVLAEMDGMSDAEFEHFIATSQMSAYEWEAALLQAKEILNATT